jgi:hypothetical protein
VSRFTIPDSFNFFGGAKSISICIIMYVISCISYRRFEMDYEKRLTRRFALPKGSPSHRVRPSTGSPAKDRDDRHDRRERGKSCVSIETVC